MLKTWCGISTYSSWWTTNSWPRINEPVLWKEIRKIRHISPSYLFYLKESLTLLIFCLFFSHSWSRQFSARMKKWWNFYCNKRKKLMNWCVWPYTEYLDISLWCSKMQLKWLLLLTFWLWMILLKEQFTPEMKLAYILLTLKSSQEYVSLFF